MQAKGMPMLEQQRLTARGLAESCRKGFGGFKSLKDLEPGKRQA